MDVLLKSIGPGLYLNKGINQITMTRKFGKHQHAKYWTAVSTFLGLISSAYRDLHNRTQKPKLYHWATGPYHTEAIPN